MVKRQKQDDFLYIFLWADGVITYDRRQRSDRKEAITIHHLPNTPENVVEILYLVENHCEIHRVKEPNGDIRLEYTVIRDWAPDDITAAIASARRQLGITDSDSGVS